MNSNIFENNEDLWINEQEYSKLIDSPSIFEDFQNPLQASIAVSYFYWKKHRSRYPEMVKIFDFAVSHAQNLAKDQ
jgi:hypothetical protein